MSICKHASSTAQFLLPYSPIGKNSWFNVPKHIFKYNGGDKTGDFLTAGNEAMKPKFLLFNVFHRTVIFQFSFNPWEEGESAKRFPARFLQHFWHLVLIFFPHSCKISGPYLVPVSNYWTWTIIEIYERDSGNWRFRTPFPPPHP